MDPVFKLLTLWCRQQARLILVLFVSDNYYFKSVYFSVVSFFYVDHMIFTVLSHSVPQNGSNALMVASGSGHTDVVQLLLSSEAQVDWQDEVRHNINYSIVLGKCPPILAVLWFEQFFV